MGSLAFRAEIRLKRGRYVVVLAHRHEVEKGGEVRVMERQKTYFYDQLLQEIQKRLWKCKAILRKQDYAGLSGRQRGCQFFW